MPIKVITDADSDYQSAISEADDGAATPSEFSVLHTQGSISSNLTIDRDAEDEPLLPTDGNPESAVVAAAVVAAVRSAVALQSTGSNPSGRGQRRTQTAQEFAIGTPEGDTQSLRSSSSGAELSGWGQPQLGQPPAMIGRPDALEQAQLHMLGVAAAPVAADVGQGTEELYTQDSRTPVWRDGRRTGSDMHEARCCQCRRRTPLEVMWQRTTGGLCPHCHEATIIVLKMTNVQTGHWHSPDRHAMYEEHSTACVWIDKWADSPAAWRSPPVTHDVRWPDPEFQQYHIYVTADGEYFHWDPCCQTLLEGTYALSEPLPRSTVRNTTPCFRCAGPFVRTALHGR